MRSVCHVSTKRFLIKKSKKLSKAEKSESHKFYLRGEVIFFIPVCSPKQSWKELIAKLFLNNKGHQGVFTMRESCILSAFTATTFAQIAVNERTYCGCPAQCIL